LGLGDREDIVAFKDNEIVVCEIKLNEIDLMRDFKNKRKWKMGEVDLPFNRFYYAIPPRLVDFAKYQLNKFARETHYKYIDKVGLIIVNGINNIKIAKTAKLLNDKKHIFNVSEAGKRFLQRIYIENWHLKDRIAELERLLEKGKQLFL